MGYVLTAYTAMYVAATLLSAVAAAFAWRRRTSPGARWLFLMLLAVGSWSLSVGFDYSSTALPVHLFWGGMSYFGSTTAPVFLLLFALEYTGWARPFSAGRIAALLAIPALSTVLAFTNDAHHLVWPGFSTVPGQPYLLIYQHGPAYWLVVIYGLALGLMSTVLLITLAVRARTLYRFQSGAVIVAVLIPWVAEILYSLNPGRWPGVDPSITMSVTGAILTVTMLGFKFLDVIPVPRQVLVEEMADGLLVLDHEARILEINPAAVRLLGLNGAPRTGCLAVDAIEEWPEELQSAARSAFVGEGSEIVSPTGRNIGVKRSELVMGGGNVPRYLFILWDKTAQVLAEQALRAAYDDLQIRMAEIEELQDELREQAIRDALTGLRNRRLLQEILERELGRAAREAYPVSLIMFDIDHFKQINDTCGHVAGDAALQAIGVELQAGTRVGDVAFRYGGDEFLIVMPNTPADAAAVRAEELRTSIRAALDRIVEGPSHAASFGVAAFPTHASTVAGLIAAADVAVYAAKAAGRDRVRVAPAVPTRPEA